MLANFKALFNYLNYHVVKSSFSFVVLGVARVLMGLDPSSVGSENCWTFNSEVQDMNGISRSQGEGETRCANRYRGLQEEDCNHPTLLQFYAGVSFYPHMFWCFVFRKMTTSSFENLILEDCLVGSESTHAGTLVL
jgi:hypothetical protein